MNLVVALLISWLLLSYSDLEEITDKFIKIVGDNHNNLKGLVKLYLYLNLFMTQIVNWIKGGTKEHPKNVHHNHNCDSGDSTDDLGENEPVLSLFLKIFENQINSSKDLEEISKGLENNISNIEEISERFSNVLKNSHSTFEIDEILAELDSDEIEEQLNEATSHINEHFKPDKVGVINQKEDQVEKITQSRGGFDKSLLLSAAMISSSMILTSILPTLIGHL